jgi:isopenicillin-N epimerase
LVSLGFGKGFVAEFDWTGTADRTAFLCANAGIAFHRRLGGPALMARNAALATEAVALLCRRLDIEPSQENAMRRAMGVVRVPVARPATPDHATELRHRLLDQRADAPLHLANSGIWLRISAYAYNEIDDYEQLAELIRRL